VFLKLPVISLGKCSDYSELSKFSKCRVVKFVIAKDRIMHVQSDLDRMNVSATTLFPGLDGFARSLHFLIGWELVWDEREDR
jgi:hypothetical protein